MSESLFNTISDTTKSIKQAETDESLEEHFRNKHHVGSLGLQAGNLINFDELS